MMLFTDQYYIPQVLGSCQPTLLILPLLQCLLQILTTAPNSTTGDKRIGEEICVDLKSLSLVILYLHTTLKAFHVFIAMNFDF